jgi:hypothetical protein
MVADGAVMLCVILPSLSAFHHGGEMRKDKAIARISQ